MSKKITSFNYQPVSEGIRLSYSYSELNIDGEIIGSNNRNSFIVQDNEIIQKLKYIKDYLEQKEN